MANYEETVIGVPKEVDYFKLPPCQQGFSRGHIVQHNLNDEINDEGPYEILIPGCTEFVDLANTNLYVKMKMVDSTTGADFPTSVAISCINNMMNSLFSQIDVELNGTMVSSHTLHHHYRSYLRTLLENSITVKYTRLESAGWIEDTPEAFDDVKVLTGDNYGLYKRFDSFLKGSREVVLYGKINIDLTTCQRYIPPGVDILLRFWRTSDILFFLFESYVVPERAKVKMLGMHLDVKKLNPSPDFISGLEYGISTKPALFPYERSRIIMYNLKVGSTSAKEDLVFQHEIPDIFVCGLVHTGSVKGSLPLNPYNFRTIGLSQITFFVNDIPVPARRYKTEVGGKRDHYSPELYMNLFTSFGSGTAKNGINLRGFAAGNGLYMINVRAAIDSEMLQVKRRGNFKIELDLDTPLPEDNTLICMGIFEDVFAIDAHKNVIKQLTSS